MAAPPPDSVLNHSAFRVDWADTVRSVGSLSTIMEVNVLVAPTKSPALSELDSSLPSSSVHGTLQARILEWAAIPFSRGSS